MSRRFVFSLVLLGLLLLTGCGASSRSQPTATPTPVKGVVDAGVEIIRQDMYLRLTQQAVENERIEAGARMTATQQVIQATSTEQMRRINAQETEQVRKQHAQETAQSNQATQAAWQVTVAAGQAQSTSISEAQSTATQWAVLGTTATVGAAATATAIEMTVQAPVVAAKAEAMDIDIKLARMELEKAQARFWFDAYGGWVVAIVLVAAFGFYLWRKSQVGVIQDKDGSVKIVMIGKDALNPSLMVRPLLTMTPGGFRAPELVPDEMQARQAHERNIVDAVGSLGPGYGRPALGLTGSLTSPQQAGSVNIQVVQPGQLSDFRREFDAKLLEEEDE